MNQCRLPARTGAKEKRDRKRDTCRDYRELSQQVEASVFAVQPITITYHTARGPAHARNYSSWNVYGD